MEQMIDPKALIRKYPLEHFNATAESYYQKLGHPEQLMAKPFIFPDETPVALRRLAALLDGLRLAKTMTVLDFGAGVCWLSRMLAQMGCRTISCDVSQTALDIGRRLFREYPIIGELIEEPAFLHFDGRRLSLPDASVDRIACYDALHHVPNLEEVIAEMGRVLKVGGIAGFSEPSPHHSRTPQSQSEMRNYGVLENDINPLDIFRIAQQHGFTRISICAPAMLEINLNEYETMIDGHSDDRLHQRLTAQVRQVLMDYSIFFLHKGTLSLDSRSPAGLSHSISSPARLPLQSQRGQSVSIPLRIRNTGNATWLTQNIRGIGVVHVGLHLYDRENRLLAFEFGRHDLPAPISPGSETDVVITPAFQQAGNYILAIDLVSEGVCWFENLGSRPLYMPVEVN